LFGRKSEKNSTPRVNTILSKKDREVQDTVEAGLYPARVTSRKGIKLFNFGIQITVIVLVVLVIASISGIFEPIRNALKSVQGDTGGLLVSSSMVPVNVYLDGRLLGASPYNGQSVPAGMHELKVEVIENEKGFFAPLTLPLQINAGNVSVVTVNPAPSAELGSYTVIYSEARARTEDPVLIVKGLPADVQIALDGVAVGQVPILRNDISEGQHKVTVSRDGYKSADIDIVISSTKTITVESKLYAYQLKLERE
jgi:hypothetical protein